LDKNLKNILVFLSHQPNPRFIKQINYLAESNQVCVIYFSRVSLPNLNSNIASNVRCFPVGQLESSGQYLSRLISYAKAIGTLWHCRRQVRAEVVITNNIDVLLLEALMQAVTLRSAKVVLEVSDLLQYMFSRGLVARLFRAIDQTLVRLFVDRLIVTSIKYYDVYYSKFFRGPLLELENKPLRKNVPPKNQRGASGGRIVIGVVGLIYQAAPIQALFDAVEGNDSVEVQIYGRLYDAQNSKALIESYCAKRRNIIFKGEYDFFRDAASIYGGLDLLYVSYDTSDSMLNNRVALPNKLYEAMYFRVPIIASRGTYLAERVMAVGIGYEIDCGSVAQIWDILKSHSERVEDFEKAFEALPQETYFADHDYQDFGRFVVASDDTSYLYGSK
jgi:glycosyltransferase involved in cell wall biosynthesis